MEIFSLIASAGALERAVVGATVASAAAQARWRYQLRFETGEHGRSIVVSCDPQRPWIGASVGRWPRGTTNTDPFAGALRRRLIGLRVRAVRRPLGDRRIEIELDGGALLIAELSPQRANLVLVDAEGRVVTSARRSPGERTRLEPGTAYRPSPAPAGRIDPTAADGEPGRRIVARELESTGDAATALRRAVLGLSRINAELVIREATIAGRTPNEALADVSRALAAGSRRPVVVGPADLLERAREGRLESDACRLLPWIPAAPPGDGLVLHEGRDALDASGSFHDGFDRSRRIAERGVGLRRILRAELARLDNAIDRAKRDLAGFEEPDRHRIRGEALLAGMAQARRDGATIRVPNPYTPHGDWLVVEDPKGLGPTGMANIEFARHRRALRGRTGAGRRIDELEARRTTLARLATSGLAEDPASMPDFEAALRAAGLAVGLEPATRARREAGAMQPARLDGIRIFRTTDGATVLVGKTARDNQRLTFQVARAEDIWLHAQGVTGAHVVVRHGSSRLAAPSATALREAAAIAAWFSEARRAGAVDVQWTRRKHVRRLRGAPPGTVGVSKFSTIRVAPRRPDAGPVPGEG